MESIDYYLYIRVVEGVASCTATAVEHAAATANIDLFTGLMGAGSDDSAGWLACLGRMLLGAPAYGESEEMVMALLKAGRRVDVSVKFGYRKETALHVAAANGAQQVSKELMLAGADPTVLDGLKKSPLHWAAEAGPTMAWC